MAYRFLFVLAMMVWSFPSLIHAGKRDGFSIVGVWMLKSEIAPDGKETSSIYTQYTRCKIYDADSTYYTVQLHAVGNEMMIIAHEMGRYRLNDSIYMERDRVMPFTVIDDTTFVTEFEGYKETMVRSNTMTEERKQEIRDLVRKYPDEAEAPVSPTEYQVCMLLKIRTKPVEIAAVLNKDKSTISSIRTRLCKKVLGKEGSGKYWDEFVLSL